MSHDIIRIHFESIVWIPVFLHNYLGKKNKNNSGLLILL